MWCTWEEAERQSVPHRRRVEQSIQSQSQSQGRAQADLLHLRRPDRRCVPSGCRGRRREWECALCPLSSSPLECDDRPARDRAPPFSPSSHTNTQNQTCNPIRRQYNRIYECILCISSGFHYNQLGRIYQLDSSKGRNSGKYIGFRVNRKYKQKKDFFLNV